MMVDWLLGGPANLYYARVEGISYGGYTTRTGFDLIVHHSQTGDWSSANPSNPLGEFEFSLPLSFLTNRGVD